MNYLSPHFSYEEMTVSQTATRYGIDNTPSPVTLGHLRETCRQLETVRSLLGHPLHISSGYRSQKLNARIGGAPTSAHCSGYAVDFICPQFGSPLEVCKAIERAQIKFDQCIEEGAWCHLSFAPTFRQQFLTAKFTDGTATYTGGIGA